MCGVLTNEQLEAISKRAEAATKGATPEWYVDEDYKDTVRCSWSGDLIAQSIPTEADAEFISHAREDVPALLAEVERLKHRLNEADELLSEAHDVLDDVHLSDSELYQEISSYFNGGDKE